MANVELCRRHRNRFIKLFHQCLRFWYGDQWTEVVEGVERRWDRRPVRVSGLDSVAKVDNQIPIQARYHISTCAQNMPHMIAVPASLSEEDKARAAFASGILRWREKADAEEELREQELLYLVGVGESVRRTGFDPDAGDPLIGDGDLLTEVLSVFSYLKDPYSIGRITPRYLIEHDARHVDWIRARYGGKVEPEKLEDTQQYENDLAMATILVAGTTRQPREGPGDSALVYRRVSPPSPRYPKGLVFVFTKDRVLDEHPLQAGIWPYSFASWYPMAKRLYPMGMVELVLMDQIEVNTLVSLLYEAAMAAVRGDIITSGMDMAIRAEVYDPKTGAKQYRLPPDTKFERVQLAADWQEAQVRYTEKLRAIREKAGTSEPSLGQALQKQVTVGELQMVQDANMQGVSWHLKRYAGRHLPKVSVQKLALLREYVAMPRMADIVGPNGETEAASFMGADLVGWTDVEPVAVPYMSPAMRQQAKFQAFKDGLMGPWETAEAQLASRQTLLNIGLEDLEREIARVYGPIEELEQKCQQLTGLRFQAEAASIQTEIMAAAAVAAQAGGEGAGTEGQSVPA